MAESSAVQIQFLFLSFQGLGTTDSVLIRIMVARAEIDMLDIKAQFLKMYGKTLHSFIKVRHQRKETVTPFRQQKLCNTSAGV